MAFFRKWKTHYKHKKFSSDDTVDGEDWGLKCKKDLPNFDEKKVELDGIVADDEEPNEALFATYDIKYLGCTPIETKRSEKVTSEAIKTVIANSKAGGRKNKTQERVKLNVSEDGIEVLNYQTHDTIMRFSIYQISYCSVDAAHDHSFSFVSSESSPLSEQEKMSCHVFQCPKRKIAHEITLMVARCFENAFENWRDTVVQNAKSQGLNLSDNNALKKIHKEQNGIAVMQSQVEVHQHPSKQEEKKSDNLLIDFAPADNDMRKYLQNTWVSFEDDMRDSGRIMAY